MGREDDHEGWVGKDSKRGLVDMKKLSRYSPRKTGEYHRNPQRE